MSEEMIVRRCKKCGAVVKVLKECNCECGFVCCGEKMDVVTPNSEDASFEKHVPTYEIKDDRIYVTVNHVMEEEHYIEWISIVSNGRECTTYFKPGMEAKTHFRYVPNSTIYAYCNKHLLWKTEVQ